MTAVTPPSRRAALTLGEGLAKALAAAGATVVVADLQDDAGQAVADGLGDGHGFVHLDVTSDEGWEDAVAQAVGHLGGLDVLVSNPPQRPGRPLA